MEVTDRIQIGGILKKRGGLIIFLAAAPGRREKREERREKGEERIYVSLIKRIHQGWQKVEVAQKTGRSTLDSPRNGLFHIFKG